MMKTNEKLEWNDLKIILAIGRAGTLSGASRILSSSHSTVFRRINAIEKKLNVRFFDRFAQGYVLTDAGETAMTTARQIDNEVHNLTLDLVGKDLRLQGTILVTAPEGVTLKLLSPAIAKFCKAHPEIHIDMIVTGEPLKLSRREADLAVRATSSPPDTTIGRYICRFPFGLYANKKFARRNKKNDFSNCNWVMTNDSHEWFSSSVRKKLGLPKGKTVFTSSSTMAVVNAIKEGMGISLLPCFLGDSETGLVRVMSLPEETTLELWLLTHPDLRNTARIKALVTFLQTSLESQKNLIEGKLTI